MLGEREREMGERERERERERAGREGTGKEGGEGEEMVLGDDNGKRIGDRGE